MWLSPCPYRAVQGDLSVPDLNFQTPSAVPSTSALMPRRSDRQQAVDALEQAFLVQFIADLEAGVVRGDPTDYAFPDSDSDSSSSDSDAMVLDVESYAKSDSSSSSSGGSFEEPSAAERHVQAVAELYSQHYWADRRPIRKDQANLWLLLNDWKMNRPEIFRSYTRLTPACFDDLVSILQDDPVFHNASNNPQMPVPEQLAIALYRFGHYGNGASTLKVALHFGVGYGTVHLVTTRVMAACCSVHFRNSALQWPNASRKENAKEWVEERSCPAWRDGWLMVDGTLVPLYQRPEFFGNTWFDRKSNYSMNVQASFHILSSVTYA